MRLIDADDFIEDLKKWSISANLFNDELGIILKQLYSDVSKEIEKRPTIEAEPVKHGKWKKMMIALTWCEDDVDIFYKCSVCGAASPSETFYCPNCGAKMDGE